MCVFCVRARKDPALANRDQALELLAQLERPGAMPREHALHVAARLLAWCESDVSRFRCEEIVPDALENPDFVDETPE